MTTNPNLARIASLIGDPARARILASLLDARSRTAGELARVSGITPQTASAHLAKLSQAGLLAVERQGRHRYYRLSAPPVGHALEALMAIAPVSEPARLGPTDLALRRVRTCYDHMAGEIAVRLATRWREERWIVGDDEWRLTLAGQRGIEALGIPLPDQTRRRPALRPCLDWSERQPHIGGQLGASLLQLFLTQDWVRRRRSSRALMLTQLGEREIARWQAI